MVLDFFGGNAGLITQMWAGRFGKQILIQF